MNKLWYGVGVVVLVALIGPFATAATLASIGTPAVDQQLQAMACSYSTQSATAGGWTIPIGQRYQLRSGFGPRVAPIAGASTDHEGVDIISTESTSAPILAASAGIVRVADSIDDSNSGRHVTIEHTGGIQTLYLHLSSLSVAVGQHVTAGQQIGIEGNTGLSTGAHLHFEYHANGTPTDPVKALQGHGLVWDGTPGGPVTGSTGAGVTASTTAQGEGEGGVGFELPQPGTPRYVSLQNAPAPIPTDIQAWYQKAAAATNLPWTLLAGVGMEETQHGRIMTGSGSAQGVMQFLPSTWATAGRDGDGDGHADINNPADSITSAAYYLVKNGATQGAAGILAALHVYNPRDFYPNDVLYYAHAYGGGTVWGGQSLCIGTGVGNPSLPPLTPARVQQLFSWAIAHVGLAYQLGAEGPDTYDCSSYVQATFRSIGVTLPRTAREQRAWVAAGNGYRVQPGTEQPGDLVFTNTWLGPNTVGHVMMVYNPSTHTSLEEAGKGSGYYDYTRFAHHNIYEIWRVGNVADTPTS